MGVYNHLPEPTTKAAWRAVRYADRWQHFAAKHEDHARSAIETWSESATWPVSLVDAGDTVFLLQLRIYVTIRNIENLYTGPGKYGETIIAFPHLTTAEHLRWWLTDWFESKGKDLLYREMTLRFWTKHKAAFSPEVRRSAALPPRPAWRSPAYHRTVTDPLIGRTVARLLSETDDTPSTQLAEPANQAEFPSDARHPPIGAPWEPWVQRMLALSQDLAHAGCCPYGFEASDRGFENFLHVLFAEEAEHRAESDAAVRCYIEKGYWPEQSPWAAYITFLRVNCAADFLCQLTAQDHSDLCLPFPHDRDDETVFVWLLIDHWERCSDVWLKLTAVSLFFSLPFYGLQPAKE